MTPEGHREQVAATLRYAHERGVRVSGAYLEDWSNGVRDSLDYVYAMVQLLREHAVERVYLADPLGVPAPDGGTDGREETAVGEPAVRTSAVG